jgi:hypothetical protein
MKFAKDTLEGAFKGKPDEMRQFMRNVKTYRETGEWPVTKDGVPLPGLDIYDAIAENSFNEIVKLGTEVNIMVKNPITGKEVPIAEAAKPGFWPHKHPYEIVKNINKNKLTHAEALKKSTGRSDEEVNRILDAWYDREKGGFKQGNLEYDNVMNLPGWMGDPDNPNFSINQALEGLRNYYQGVARRLSDLKYLEGYADDKWKLSDVLNKIEDKETRAYIKRITDMTRGIDRYDRTFRNEELAAKVRNVNVMRKMWFSFTQNWMQTDLGTIPRHARMGFMRTLRNRISATRATFRDLTSKDAEQISIEIGETMETMLGIGKHGWSAKGANTILKGTSFKVSETYNRIFSQKMGEKYVQHAIDALHNRPNAPDWFKKRLNDNPKFRTQLIDELKGLGVSMESIKAGYLKGAVNPFGRYGVSEGDLAAYQFSRSTQFRHTAMDVPYIMSASPWWKTWTQFMPFTFSQAKLYKDHILKPFLKNPTMDNAKPLLQHLAGALVTGEVNHQIRRFIESKVLGIKLKEDEPYYMRLMDYYIMTSSMAMVYNYYMNAKYGKSMFVGSAMGDVDKAIQSTIKGRVPVEMIAPSPLDKKIRQEITGGY